MDKIEGQLKEIIAEIAEKEPGEILPDASFVEDLGIDSMMALEILASIEKKFKVVMPEESLPKITTFNQTVSLVKDILTKKR